MTESVKQRMSGTHLGRMSDTALRKLFETIQSDLAANLADRNNLQIIVNNRQSFRGLCVFNEF